MNDTPITTAEWQPISYYVETDTMAVEIRPSPGREEDDAVGRDAGTDLVVHYAPDGHPWMWEIEHASRHPDHIAAAIAELRRQSDENGASSLARNPAQSTAYELFYRAMSERKQIFCTYDGYRRELCPIILGHSKGKEKALAFQFGGESKSGLPRAGDWRCLWLSRVRNVELHEGPWHAGSSHKRPQGCVEVVDVDVNPGSPYNPKRRL